MYYKKEVPHRHSMAVGTSFLFWFCGEHLIALAYTPLEIDRSSGGIV